MAAVTHLYSSSNTASGTAPATPGVFTPTGGRLVFVFVAVSDSVAAGGLTGSANGLTFTLVDSAVGGSGPNDTLYLYVANQLTPAGPVPMTLTHSASGDSVTGSMFLVGEVAGMERVGSDAVRQSDVTDSGSGAVAATFPASALTGNPTVFGVLGLIGSHTAPTSWTKLAEETYTSPATFSSYHRRNSGFTGTTITLGSSAGQSGAVAVEFDSSAAPGSGGGGSGDEVLAASPAGVVRVSGAELQTEYSIGLTPVNVRGVRLRGAGGAGFSIPTDPLPAPGEDPLVQWNGTDWITVDLVQIVGAARAQVEIAQWIDGEWVVLGGPLIIPPVPYVPPGGGFGPGFSEAFS